MGIRCIRITSPYSPLGHSKIEEALEHFLGLASGHKLCANWMFLSPKEFLSSPKPIPR